MDCRSFRHHACQPGRLFCLKWVQYRYFSGLIGSAVKVILVFGYDPSFMEKKPPEKSFQTKILKMAVESEQVDIGKNSKMENVRGQTKFMGKSLSIITPIILCYI